jgi:hypothetical protein
MIKLLPASVRPLAQRTLVNDDIIIGNLLQEVMVSDQNKDQILKFSLDQISQFEALLREVCSV